MKDWQEQVNKALSAASTALAKAQASPTLKDDNTRKIFEDAKYNIEFVRAAHGVHNLDYSLSILENSKAQLEKIADKK